MHTPRYTKLADIQADLFSDKTTCVELVTYYLHRIEKKRSLNAYIEVFQPESLQRAAELDKKYQENPKSVGRLFGAVVSIKDVICYAGHQVTASSKILEGFRSLYSATAVERLLSEDAIIIGRTNCDQFAMGSSNENSVYGAVRNAANPAKVPGGSSGGAAVSVQADTCWASLGSDTGGSVRQPAAFCGLVGLKPSYGRISRHGLLAYGSSFDQIGTFTRSVEDAALLLEIMSGADDFDGTASQLPVPTYFTNVQQVSPETHSQKSKIVYFKQAVDNDGIDPQIRAKTIRFIEQLREKGHLVEAVDFEYLDYIIPAYYVLTTAEASSNLSRYDGVRYGHRAAEAKTLDEVYKKSRTEGFSEEVKRRIMLGTFVLSSGYYDAYYTKAQQVRRLIAERTRQLLATYDFILMPTSPVPAWDLGAKINDPVSMYLMDIFTVQANMVGIPAISMPLGKDSAGCGIGIQLMADKFKENELLKFVQSIHW
jgi:aspartyl-tRNA(Asn)/glutamyl-tRNA(Gln) amidotransferase subunit A